MTHKPSPPKRIKDQPSELFDGKLVNRPKLRQVLGGCPDSQITRMIKQGLPFIPLGPRKLFDPEAALEWFRNRQKQVNVQPERKRR